MTRIVVKESEASLIKSNGMLNYKTIDRMAMLLSDLHNSGKQVVFVTAGAIAAATEKLGLTKQPQTLHEKQALSAIGQSEFIKIYQNAFNEYNQLIAQVLLTRQIINRSRIKNARNTIETLLKMDIIPIINENDTVSTDDIEQEENYPLTRIVANHINADMIAITPDKNGNFIIIPRNSNSIIIASNEDEFIEKIEKITNNLIPLIPSKLEFPKSIDLKKAMSCG